MSVVLLFALLLFQETPQAQPAQPQTQRQAELSKSDIAQLKTKADAGDASAELSLAQAYEDGNGVPQNDEQAVTWYRKAADQGNAGAQNNLGVMYRMGRGVPRDKEEALKWYRKAARQKDGNAMFNVGTAYYNGDGVGDDVILAYAWFLLGAEQGNAAATDAVTRTNSELSKANKIDTYIEIAEIYEKGVELEKDLHEAIKWYERAASENSPGAKVKLALMYINGEGVQKDFAHALGLCKSAADQESPQGMYCVALCYQNGWGVPAKDPKSAFKWHRKAADAGYRSAMIVVGEMYRHGEGTAVDRAEAYLWFFRAYQRRSVESQQHAADLWSEMTRDDIKRLEKKLRAMHYDPKKVFEVMKLPPSSSSPNPN
jgi:TPR repeat protein